MNSYLVRRHGSNAANQSMTPVAAVAIVNAETIEAARKIASEKVNCYNNQHLELVEEAEADTDEWNGVSEADAQLPPEESIIYSA